MKSLNIGSIKLKNPLFLAPMVDVTDLPYRLLCREAGAAMAYTEMIYIDAIVHENPHTKEMMKTSPKDSPLGIQITGNNLNEFKKAISYLKKYDIVDINCGCPSIRITGNQAGSYLLNDPEKIAEIIKLLKKEGITVTAKIRLGFNKNEVLRIVKIIESAGADAITVHARLGTDSYKVPSDLSQIALVKKAVKIPVIGNGDIFTGKDAKEMLKVCDGVMIARGAIGDPLIFKRFLHYLKTGKEQSPDFKENLKQFSRYIQLAKKHNLFNIPKTKYLGGHFIKGTKGTAKQRQILMSLKSYEEIEQFINSLINN